MSRISATTDMLPGKAIFQPREAAQPQAAPAADPKRQPPQAPSAAKPSRQLQGMLDARRQGANTSLKAMIADAGAELARQSDMIEDIDRILAMEKAQKAYAGK